MNPLLREHNVLASRDDWAKTMSNVPAERRQLFLEIRTKLVVMFNQPIKETEAVLDDMVSRFKPGSRIVGGVKYEWRLARMPYYVEWRLSKPSGEVQGVLFQMIGEFLAQDWEKSREGVADRNRSRTISSAVRLEMYVLEGRRTLPNSSQLSSTTLRALGKQRQDKRRKTWEDKILNYLTGKGYSKYNIESVTIPISQLLAESYNEQNTGSEYFALTWDDCKNDPGLQNLRKSSKKKRKNKKKKAKAAANKQSLEVESITSDEEAESPQVPEAVGIDTVPNGEVADAVDPQSALVKETSISESSGSDKSTSSVMDDLSAGDATTTMTSRSKSHDLSTEGPEDISSDADTEILVSPKDKGKQKAEVQSFAAVYGHESDNQSEDLHSDNEEERLQNLLEDDDFTQEEIFALLSRPADSQPDSQSDTMDAASAPMPDSASKPSSSATVIQNSDHICLPPPASDNISSHPVGASPQPPSHSVSSGFILRAPVPIPYIKHLMKPKKAKEQEKQSAADKKTELSMSSASSTTQSKINKDDALTDTKPPSTSKAARQYSVLRGEAPVFVPMACSSQSPESSSAVSPEAVTITSLPMSVTTSATSHLSIGGGLDQSNDIQQGVKSASEATHSSSYSIKDAPMIYPSESSIRELKKESLQRPRSRSTSRLPSETVNTIDKVQFAEEIVEPEHLLEAWPEFKDDHLEVATPWRYAEHHETAESIIMNYGHLINHYRPSPWYTEIRRDASRENNIPLDVPAVLMKTRSGFPLATGQFDIENNLWRVFAPSAPLGDDVRVCEEHPDYLEPEKLLEVQGLESFLFRVHVAVRTIHECRREGCTKMLRDDHPNSVVCRGCGPLSTVRYCSLRCSFDDLPNHWEDCGSSKFFPPVDLYIDPDITFPSRFSQFFPMIKDISGWDSMERHRIHLLSFYLDGDYGVYPGPSMDVMHVRMPPGRDSEMKRRVQRLINCALLDRRNRTLISYLYVLVRDALCKQIKTRVGEFPVVLRYQFLNEWNFDFKGLEGYELLDTMEPCECWWTGAANTSCDETCKAAQALGDKFRDAGLKPLVEELEKEHWLLRAWHTLHPNISDWRERVFGKGFHGVKPKKFKNLLPVLGVGYEGFISKDMVVGSWRKRLNLEASPPKVIRLRGKLYQDPHTFIWKEPTE